MGTFAILRRSLTYYWRTNLAVVLGVAAAVAVLAGALLVGDSVRSSLRDLFLMRLGQTDHVIASSTFFRESLGDELGVLSSIGFSTTTPLIELEGTVSNDTSRARAGKVRVYGVDQRFWQFHGRLEQATPGNREVFVSESLARELNSSVGESLLIQIEKPSEVPIESLYGRKEDLGRTLRLTIKEVLDAKSLGEFAVRPQQTAVRAVFMPLDLLQAELDQQGKVNTLLVSSLRDGAGSADVEATKALETRLKDKASVEDYNIKLRLLEERQSISLERGSTLVDDALAQAATKVSQASGSRTVPVLSYVANSITSGSRSIPYSLVTAIDDSTFESLCGVSKAEEQPPQRRVTDTVPPIVLNDWAARELNAKPGDEVSLEYFVWHEDGRLETKSAQFQLIAVVPISGLAADRDLVPEYPGITESANLSDWDPPFPVDLRRIRKQDEDYWDQYRTTPKAFIALSEGQQLWQSRFGKLTSLRVIPSETTSLNDSFNTFREKLRSGLNPSSMGLMVLPVRREGLAASQGATDFGEYFLYFSFFLVISALMLTALFFKLGIEQRVREIGLLQAVGFSPSAIRKLFLTEGILLALIGSVLGLVGAIGYGKLMMYGLRTWWVDAVGTTMLSLHVSPLSLLIGAVGGVVAAVLCILWTLRRVNRASARSLLAGSVDWENRKKLKQHSEGRQTARSLRLLLAIVFAMVGTALLLLATMGVVGKTAGFFGGGTLLLVSLLCFQSVWLRLQRRKPIAGKGVWPVLRLGFRNATYRPGRSVLSIALIASATFIIVSVDAFRRGDPQTTSDQKSGSGGFPLLAESVVPIVQALDGSAESPLKVSESPLLSNAGVERFRLRPGDDASCLNLYQPRNPRILSASEKFIQSNRFLFQQSQATSTEEQANPWLLLNRELNDGAIPVVADANSINYVLHLKIGDDFVLNDGDRTIKLRIVGALADSVFQSELLMAEKNFIRLFPQQQGYRFFLIETPNKDAQPVAVALEDRLADFGFDVVSTNDRLANFHRVENTYLSTFQMLGGLGLLLGTLGMAAVLLRNILERRRELALLRAVGYNSSHFTLMVLAENALLLFLGLATGWICAMLAIAPVFFERGGGMPNVSLGVFLLAVLLSGLIASLVAIRAALNSPLIPALRAE